jgi:hypothetical protein
MPTIYSLEGLNEKERLACALRSTDEHIFEEGFRALVTGPDADGNLRLLGCVDLVGCLQKGSPGLSALVDRVRFGYHLKR